MLWSRDHARHQKETLRLQRQLTTALADLSAATRLQAINRATKAPAGDSIVAGALVNALLHDQNANVRVAAAEALAQLAPPRAIRLAAAQGLVTESSPFVQVALLDVVRPLGAAERARVVRQLLARPDIDPIVRQAAARLSTL
jgi:HEAT repeat protein